MTCENSPVALCLLSFFQVKSWAERGYYARARVPFLTGMGRPSTCKRYQKCFSHNHERNGRTTLIVNIKGINFVGLHVFSTYIPIQGNLIFPDLSFSTYSIKDSEHKNTFLHKLRLYLLLLSFFFKSVHKLCSYIQFVF